MGSVGHHFRAEPLPLQVFFQVYGIVLFFPPSLMPLPLPLELHSPTVVNYIVLPEFMMHLWLGS